MTDQQLLEAAASALGIYYWREVDTLLTHGDVVGSTREWNPLTDDGDAFRLAVKLRIDILLDPPDCQASCVEAIANHSDGLSPFAIETLDGRDEMAATRRAVVRAAAAMAQGEQP